MSRAIVLVGHGSRRAEGNAAVQALGRRLAAHAGLPVHAGFIELARPTVLEAVAAAVAGGAREVALVPAVLLAAGHAKNDLPAIADRARREHPGVKVAAARPIGIDGPIVAALREGLAAARAGLPPVEDRDVAALLLGRGCSDPDANAQVHRLARLVWERSGLLAVEVGYVGVTEPDLPTALHALAARRPRQVVVMPFLLYPGVLVDRVARQAADVARLYPRLELAVAAPIGVHPAIEATLLRRAEAALSGDDEHACDVCKYRTPLPGYTREVGGKQARRKAAAHLAVPPEAAEAHGHAAPDRHVLVCVNRDCADRGSLEVLDRLRQGLRRAGKDRAVQTTRALCLGRCGEGPAVAVYPDGVWYRGVTPAHAETILEEHLLGDRPVGALIDQVLG